VAFESKLFISSCHNYSLFGKTPNEAELFHGYFELQQKNNLLVRQLIPLLIAAVPRNAETRFIRPRVMQVPPLSWPHDENDPSFRIGDLCVRAGIKPWPKLFQNLRCSRPTELTKSWPAHVLYAWLGNTEVVARNRDLKVTDEHFASATRDKNASLGAESDAAPVVLASQDVAPLREAKIAGPEVAKDERRDATRRKAPH
jgi:hypothetical protein